MPTIAEQGGWPGVILQKIEDRSARKQALTDEQHADQREKYLDIRDNLKTQINSYPKDPKTGKVLPEYSDQYDKATAAQTQNEYNIGQLYDPIKAPGRLQADWHYLRERIHGIKQPTPTPTQSPAVTLPAFAPAPITTPEMPAYQQTTPGLPSQGGGVTTTVPGVAATTMPGMASAPITMPAVSLPKVTKMPWAAGRVQELKDKAMQKAQQEAKTLEAGAGLSPEQTATVNANAANAGSLAAIQGKIKNYRTLYRTLNPSATEEEESKDVSAYASSLIPGNEQIGNWSVKEGTLNGQPYPLSYDSKTGKYKMPDNTYSSTPPENWKPTEKSAGGRPVLGYSAAVNLDLARNQQTQGTVYNGQDGNSIDLSSLPDGSVLIPVFEGGGKSYWSVANDKGRYETGDNLRKFEPAVGGPVANPQNVGQVRVSTSRTSVTPGPGGPVVTSSVTSPMTGGGGVSRPAAVRQAIPNQPGTHPAASKPSGAAQPSSQPAPPKQTRSSDIPPMRDPKLPPMKGADERAISNLTSPVATVEQQVVGRGAKPLWEYSSILNNPDLLKATNWAMAAPMLQTPEGSKNPGFWNTITLALGLATAAQKVTTEQIVAARNKVQNEGGPQAVEFLDRLAELKGTIPNLRKIQGGSSAMGAMQPLYQESPIMNISSPEDFRNRTANMLRTMAVALDQVPGINKAHVNWLYGQADQAQSNSVDVLKKQAALLNAPPPPPAQHKAGDQVMLGGKIVTIKNIYPDGTFDY
jgi:hypothetical protein